MKIAEIKREKCSVTTEAMPSILDEAREVLSYGSSRAVIQERTSPLRELLATLEIEPLIEADVVRYQAEMIAELMLDPSFQRERLEARRQYRFFHYWEGHSLEQYGDPIPEFVLSKAIQIKKACPEVKFYVETLQGNPDPFLVAQLGDDYGKDYAYIEVWEEPKFEGRLR